MGIIENPLGSGGQGARIEDIHAHRAAGAITQDEANSLLSDEATTSNYIGLKRGALAALLLFVGFFFLMSSL